MIKDAINRYVKTEGKEIRIEKGGIGRGLLDSEIAMTTAMTTLTLMLVGNKCCKNVESGSGFGEYEYAIRVG